jgi:hypothetical protein
MRRERKFLADREHGTERTYRAGCSCDTCRIAQTARVIAWRERKRAEQASDREIPHGITGYTTYQCRCGQCMEACRKNARLYRKYGTSAGRMT